MEPISAVLVVDDEPFIRRALTFVLNREGYETATASDGSEALQKIRALRPKLVFLDVMMPGRDGFEVCREIKADPLLRSTHVILLTARGQDSDRAAGLSAGADEYMTKPFSPSQVLARVRDLVGFPDAAAARRD
jgi:two-component system, OmpR family, alkaline phosphatase synthesis response regulator PhoP